MGLNTRRRLRGLSWPAAVAFICTLVTLAALSSANAQETPDGPTPAPLGETPEGTPGETPAPGETQIRLEIDAPEDPMPEGDEFQVRVLVDNVEHMAGFGVTIGYDPDLVEPVEQQAGEGTPQPTEAATTPGASEETSAKASQLGEILAGSPRSDGLFCPPPFARDNGVAVQCVTTLPPVCLTGPAGASGSGPLAVLAFRGVGGGLATFQISESTLALDDYQPCEAEEVVAIAHTRGDPVSIEIKGSDGSSVMLIAIIVAVVAVFAGVAAGGYLWYRRRAAA